jgi:acyl-CoA thioester hydrolase
MNALLHEAMKQPSRGRLTYRGAVDAWECDQMGHMNIQFYAQRFDLSEQVTLDGARHGVDSDFPVREKPNPLRERWTFHNELRAGAPIEITMSTLEPVDPEVLRVRHTLTKADDGVLAATADIDYEVSEAEQQPQRQDPRRSVQPSVPVDKNHAGLRHCGRSPILDGDIQNTSLRRQKLVAMLNHASCHAGLERGRQRDLEGRLIVGSATLDMEIIVHGSVLAGMLLDVRSMLTRKSGKLVDARYVIIDAGTDTPLYSVTATHVFFDARTRKAIEIPEPMTPVIT